MNEIEKRPIKIRIFKDAKNTWSPAETEGYWVVTVSGITSGCIVHGGTGDNMTIEFRFDAHRFKPYIDRG